MPIFLDSSNLELVEKFHRMGIIRGVTTNPTIMLNDGVVGGISGIEARAKSIAHHINPLPVAVEVTTNDRYKMIDQAKSFSSWAENIIVKLTIHGPQGEEENLEVVHQLESEHNIRVNVTAVMNAQQGVLAALAGATYVSIFGGRVNDMGYNACEEITKLRKVLDAFDLKAQIIVGSTREILNVIEWLGAGAHIVTAVPDILRKMLVHPYSKETVQMFLRDGAAVEEMIEGTRSKKP